MMDLIDDKKDLEMDNNNNDDLLGTDIGLC